jgi:hypothetical protein
MFTWLPLLAAFSDPMTPSPVLAYLDPGAGSMLLQVLIAGIFSSLFFAKSSITYVRNLLLAKKK